MGPLLLIWINFNLGVDKYLYVQKSGIKFVIHSQIWTVQPFKFENG